LETLNRQLHPQEGSMKRNVIDQLRKVIIDSGESQLSIADATGINQGNLSKFLRDERNLSLENFAVLCDYFKLKLSRR
jgi:transcriptional regulator with XRE-family HTH domain